MYNGHSDFCSRPPQKLKLTTSLTTKYRLLRTIQNKMETMHFEWECFSDYFRAGLNKTWEEAKKGDRESERTASDRVCGDSTVHPLVMYVVCYVFGEKHSASILQLAIGQNRLVCLVENIIRDNICVQTNSCNSLPAIYTICILVRL